MSNVAKLKKRALEYEQKKQTDKALETYIQLLGMLDEHVDEADVALYNRVGDLMLRKGNVAAAVDHYERAVDLYTEGGFFNNATALCNKILRSAPGRNSIYYKLGRISAKNGFVNDARQNFLEYADRMQRIGQIDEAYRALKEFADLCPDQDDIRLMLADQLAKGDRNAEAIDQLQFLFEKFQAEGRTSEARATLERMRAIDPNLQPKQGVARPTPKSNDLIFLDVNYDDPARVPKGAASDATRSPDRSQSAPPRATDSPAGGSRGAGTGAAASEAHPAAASRFGQFAVEPGAEPLASGAPQTETSRAGSPGAPNGVAGHSPAAPTGPGEHVQGLAVNPSVEDLSGSMLPLLEVDFDSATDFAPPEGLSPGAGLNGQDGYDHEMVAAGASGNIDHVDATSIPGLEQSVFGGATSSTEAIEPIADLEYTTRTIGDDDPQRNSARVEPESAAGSIEATQPGAWDSGSGDYLRELDSGVGSDAEAERGTDDLPLILPSRDAEVSERVPLAQRADEAAAEQEPEWPAAASNSGRIAPLLQLPEFGLAQEAEADLDIESRLGQLSAADSEPESPIWPADALSPMSDPRAGLASGYGNGSARDPFTDAADDATTSGMGGLAGLEYIDIGDTPHDGESTPEPELRPIDRLRAEVESMPENWELRRRLGEALLEEGDRRGGLAELEAAMLGFEKAGDMRNAADLVDEIIRVEPNRVRFHQKRVEYAVRSSDRVRLADAYFALAESLFRSGELEKSHAVYGRVLNLSPGNARARAALEAISDLLTPVAAEGEMEPDEPVDAPAASVEPESIPEPPGVARQLHASNGSTPARSTMRDPESIPASSATWDPGSTPASSTMRDPQSGERESQGAADQVFVNLGEWLREDEPVKNTRMVVDVREPETQEQADFAEMLSMFKQGVAANVDDADHESHYDLGVAYKEMGLLDEAISEFQKALRGAEQRARAYEALGQCFVEKGQPQIAVTILSRALGDKQNTDDMLVGVLYLLGLASETIGRMADAQRFYERVYGVDIDFRDVRERLAAVKSGAQ